MLLSKELTQQLDGLASFIGKAKELLDAIKMSEDLKRRFLDLCDNTLKLRSAALESQGIDNYYDFRLSHLLVKNFRKYGAYDDENVYTGLYAKDVQVLYLLGNNGSGKSSMFNAAEYIFTNDISEARYRCYSDNKQYIRHKGQEPIVKAVMKNGAMIDLSNRVGMGALELLPLSSFFISEYSIYKAGNKIKDMDFLPYICELLGIGYLYDFAFGDVVKDVINNLGAVKVGQNELEAEAINKIKSAIEDYVKEERENEKSPVGVDRQAEEPASSVTQKGDDAVKDKLKELSEIISEKLAEHSGQDSFLLENIVKATNELLNIRKDIVREVNQEDIKKSTDQLKSIRDGIAAGIVQYVNDIVDNDFKEIVNQLFDRYTITDGERPQIHNIEGNVMSITANGVSVVKYFNTFRFRMFFLIMQTACCLKLMKKFKVLFPIFMDDIFYANDYHNKIQLKGFFEVVLKYVLDNFSDDRRPQLIFFSHDEQIILSLYQSEESQKVKIIFGKVLSVADLSQIESTKKIAELNEGKVPYHNIYVEIFKK